MIVIRNVRQLVLVLVVLVHAAASLPRLVDAAVHGPPPPVDGTDEVLSQVGFGSCSRQHFDQSYWPLVTAALTTNTAPNLHAPVAPRPQCATRNTEAGNTSMAADSDGCVDGFAWLGDVIYGDACLRLGGCTPNSYAVMRETFESFRRNKHYAAFVETVKRSSAHALAAAPPQHISSVFGEHSPQGSRGVTAPSKPSDTLGDTTSHPSAVVSPRRVVGVWDDHDMGQNNGGAEFEHKDRNQQLFLDFLDAPRSSPRRARKGLYSVSGVPFRDEHTRGGKRSVLSESPDRNGSLRQDDQAHGRRKNEEETNASHRSVSAQLAAEYDFAVCTVLLDVRYFADLGSDLLGEPQWAWLDEVFSGGPVLDAELGPSVEGQGPVSGSGSTQRRNEKKAEGAAHQATRRSLSERCLFTMIGSGIQVLADEKPAEHWGQYPGARQRLFSLLRRRRMERFVFISGDVHIGEVQAVAPFDGQGAAALRNGVGPLRIPVIDVTASGLTHTVDFPFLHSVGLGNILPSRRVMARYVGKNFGTATLTARRLPQPRTGGGAASHRDVEVTASLCIHRVEDGAAVIRHDVDLFGDLRLPDSDSDGIVETGGDEAGVDSGSGRRDGSSASARLLGKESLPGPHPHVPHWLRSRSKAALQAEFRECPLSCDLSRVPPSPIRELVIFVQWALPVRATLPVVIKGLLLTGVTVFASLIVLCAYILCRRWVRALRGRVPKSKFE